MKKKHILSILSILAISLVGCKSQSEQCTVKGSVQGYCVEFIPSVFLIDCKAGEILVHDAHPDLDSILSDLHKCVA